MGGVFKLLAKKQMINTEENLTLLIIDILIFVLIKERFYRAIFDEKNFFYANRFCLSTS